MKGFTQDTTEDLSGKTSPVLYQFCLRYPTIRVIIRGNRKLPQRLWLVLHASLRHALRGDLVSRPGGVSNTRAYLSHERRIIERVSSLERYPPSVCWRATLSSQPEDYLGRHNM